MGHTPGYCKGRHCVSGDLESITNSVRHGHAKTNGLELLEEEEAYVMTSFRMMVLALMNSTMLWPADRSASRLLVEASALKIGTVLIIIEIPK